jgi:filamentous hemagglutinin family protein
MHSFSPALVMALMCGSAASAQQGAPKAIEVQGVTSGQATVRTAGPRTTIHASDGAIINYGRFGVPAGNSVEFVQPGASSRVLNRIVGGEPTRIDGALTANGIVYLVNPAGVAFGAGSVVDVGGIVAAAGRITDADFAAGLDRFVTSNASVDNAGSITADRFAHLIGRATSNSGSIVSQGGVVSMTSGGDVYLSESGRRLKVRVDAFPASGPLESPPEGRAQGVVNTGSIEAGEIALSSGDLYALALESAGTARAPGGDVAIRSGGHARISGEVDVSASVAGSIDVHARTATLTGKLRALGERGGSIGFTSDLSTLILGGALVDVSGGAGVGDGGEVLVHAFGGDTRFEEDARVDVSGGDVGGHGGALEISAGKRLHVAGQIDASALPGFAPGSVLFDPLDILIATPGTHDPNLASGQILRGQGSGETWTVSPSVIENSFGAVTLEATRDISVNEAVDAPFGELILDAGRDVNVNAPLSAGGIELRAGRDVNAPLGVSSTWTLDLISGGNIVTGDLSALFVNVDAGGSVIGVGSPELTAGITLELAAGEEILGFSRLTGGFQAIIDGPVTLTEHLTASGAFGVTWRGPIDGELGSRRDLTVEGPGFFERPVGANVPLGAVDVQGQATLRGAGIFAVEDVSVDGILLAANARIEAHDIHVDGSINSGSSGPFRLTLVPTGEARFERMVGDVSPLRSLTVDGDVELSRHSGIATADGLTILGDARIDANASGPISLNGGDGDVSIGSLAGGGGASLLGANVAIGEGGSAIDLSGDLLIAAQMLSIDGSVAAGDVSIDAGVVEVVGDMTVGDASLRSDGPLRMTGDIDAGDLALSAPDALITGDIDAGEVTLSAISATLLGDVTAGSLHIDASGDVRFVGDVVASPEGGGGGPYQGLEPGSILISAGSLTFGGSMTADRIGLETPVLIEDGAVFDGRLAAMNSIDALAERATLEINGDAWLRGPVGSITPLGSLTSAGALDLGGDVLVHGGIELGALSFDGDRRIESLTGDVSLAGVDGPGALAVLGSRIELAGDVGSIERPASLTLTGPVTLGSDRISVRGPIGLTGDVALTRGADIASAEGVAIGGRVSGPFDLVINGGADVRLDGGVEVSSLRIDAASADVGDILAESIAIDAGSVTLLGRRYQAQQLELVYQEMTSTEATFFVPEELIGLVDAPGVRFIPLRNGEPAGSLTEMLGVDRLVETFDLPQPGVGTLRSPSLALIQDRTVAPDIRSALVEEDN